MNHPAPSSKRAELRTPVVVVNACVIDFVAAFAVLEWFSGMFREGEKHGPGSLLTAEGDTLEGEWSKSRPQEGDVSLTRSVPFFVLFDLFFVPISVDYALCW